MSFLTLPITQIEAATFGNFEDFETLRSDRWDNGTWKSAYFRSFALPISRVEGQTTCMYAF